MGVIGRRQLKNVRYFRCVFSFFHLKLIVVWMPDNVLSCRRRHCDHRRRCWSRRRRCDRKRGDRHSSHRRRCCRKRGGRRSSGGGRCSRRRGLKKGRAIQNLQVARLLACSPPPAPPRWLRRLAPRLAYVGAQFSLNQSLQQIF